MQVVVTGVQARAHLLHIAAWLRKALEENSEPIHVHYVRSGPFMGKVVHEHHVRAALPRDARVTLEITDTPTWSRPGRKIVLLCVGAPGIKPWTRLRKANPVSRIRVVVTDEGLGSYGDWRTRRAAWQRQGVPEPWRSVRTAAVSSAVRGLTTERFAMYDARHDWALEPHIAQEFRRGIERDRVSDRVVVLTQPWVEFGVLKQRDYLAFIGEVASVVRSEGARPVIKPHPVEKLEKYSGLQVWSSRQIAERDPRVVRARAVVGGTTTALVNLKALHGVPAARISVPGLEYLDEGLGRQQQQLLEHYLPPVADVRTWAARSDHW